MSQAVAIVTTFVIEVLLICWFGTQLTHHVRDNYVLYSKAVTYIIGEPQEIRKSATY